MVDIREYWQDSDGELKPGKKGTMKTIFTHFISVLCAGIALSMDQWDKLKGFATDIDKKIKEIS